MKQDHGTCTYFTVKPPNNRHMLGPSIVSILEVSTQEIEKSLAQYKLVPEQVSIIGGCLLFGVSFINQRFHCPCSRVMQ